MAASYTRVASLIIQELAAADTYVTTSSDPRFYTQGIQDAITEAEAFIAGLILASDSFWRGVFTPTSSTVAHLGTIPAHVGPILTVQVDSKGADLWSKSEIEFERLNPLTLTTLGRHYHIDGNAVLYHNGTTSTVEYYTFTSTPGTLQVPDAFEEAIAAKALAFLINVEGENTAAAAQYDTHWRATLNYLLGSSNVPQES